MPDSRAVFSSRVPAYPRSENVCGWTSCVHSSLASFSLYQAITQGHDISSLFYEIHICSRVLCLQWPHQPLQPSLHPGKPPSFMFLIRQRRSGASSTCCFLKSWGPFSFPAGVHMQDLCGKSGIAAMTAQNRGQLHVRPVLLACYFLSRGWTPDGNRASMRSNFFLEWSASGEPGYERRNLNSENKNVCTILTDFLKILCSLL